MDRILIAEDDESFRTLLVHMVQEAFPTADIWTAKDGAEALQKYKTWNADAVITDYQMPYVSGERLAAYIRESGHNSDVPIILITGGPELVKDTTLFTAIFNKGQVMEAIELLKHQQAVQ